MVMMVEVLMLLFMVVVFKVRVTDNYIQQYKQNPRLAIL